MTKQLRDLLGRLRAHSGCDVAAAVGTDGLLIESSARPGFEVEAIAAVATNGLVMAEAVGREIAKGGTRQAILEYHQGLVVIEPLNDEVMLLLVASSRDALGRTRFWLELHREAFLGSLITHA